MTLRRAKPKTTTGTSAAASKPPTRSSGSAAPTAGHSVPPRPRRRRLRKEPRHHRPASSDDEDRFLHRHGIRRDDEICGGAQGGMPTGGGRFGAKGLLDYAFGSGGDGGGGGGERVRESMGLSGGTDGTAGLGSGLSRGDEEGLGLLRQQLSAVQRIRIEHERKDATIAELRLEVSSLSQQREEMLALDRERNGEFIRLTRIEERCRRLEKGERAALVKARAETAAAVAAARHEEAARAEAEYRAGATAERLNTDLDRRREQVKGLEENLRMLEKELASADRLVPRVKSLEEANEALRAELATAARRRSEAEHELSQLQVFRPLLDRADSIDRSRLAAEEALRVATAELGREREVSTAARQDAAELRLALDRRGSRLVEAEAEASKVLALERDLVSTTGRMEVAEAARGDAVRARRDAEAGGRAAAAVLDDLAELAFEGLPRSLPVQPVAPPSSTEAPEAAAAAARVGVRAAAGFPVGSQKCGGRSDSAGGGSGDGRKRDVISRLTALEAGLRSGSFVQPSSGSTGKQRDPGVAVGRRDPSHTPEASGDGAGERAGDEHGQRGGGDSGVISSNAAEEKGWWCSEEMAGIRRAVRAVRALVEAGTGAAADRDRVMAELTGARAELQSALDRLESSRTEVARLGRALEEACAARSALLPRLRDSQVSKEALEAVADKASSELADVRDFLNEVAGVLARSGGGGGGGGGSSSEAFTGDGDAFSPGWTSINTNTNTDADSGSPVPQGERREGGASGPATASPADDCRSGSRSARLISAVAAGVQGLLAERATTADALRELDRRCSRARKDLEEMRCAGRDRDAAHREQLVELRKWCENEVEGQRRAKKAGQAAADCALRDLSTASKKVSALAKDGSRLRKRLAAANLRVSSLAEEACAAKADLRLLARACAPLLERCRVLAAQKRLLTRWHGPSTMAVVAAAAAAAERGGAGSAVCPGRGGPRVGGAVVQPNAMLIIDGLRTLVGALSAEGGQRESGLGCCDERETGGGNSSIGAENATGSSIRFHGQAPPPQKQQQKQQQERPLVSLRAVAVAAVAVERLKRLGTVRAARRASAKAAAAAAEAAAAAAAAAAVNDAVESDTPKAAATPAAVNAEVFGGGGGGGSGGGGRGPRTQSTSAERTGTSRYPHRGFIDDEHDHEGGGVIPLGQWGSGGGVALLGEHEVVPTTALTLSVLLTPGGDGADRSAAARCLRLLGELVVVREAEGARGGGAGVSRVFDGGLSDAAGFPSLLQLLAGGQAGHWRRLERRGLVPSTPWGCGADGDGEGNTHRLWRGGASRVIAARCARHHGREVWNARQQRVADEQAMSLLEATRRGTAALARLAGEAETRLLESEARRQRAKAEVEARAANEKALRAALDRKSETVAFLEERVRMMEGEVSGSVPASALAGAEKALTQSLAEVETLRARSASLYAELAEASAQRKREAKQARKGAQVASQEKAIRAQLQDELLSLRSYVLRSEQTVQDLQEQARRQAREAGRHATDGHGAAGGGGGDGSGSRDPLLAVADTAYYSDGECWTAEGTW